MDKKQLQDFAILAFFALYGSVARTLADNRENGKSGAALVWLLFCNGVIAGFCGLIVGPLSHALKLEPGWKLFAAGMAGYMGLGFLVLLEKMVKEKFGNANNP